MTREDLKRQVLARVDVMAEYSGLCDAALEIWLTMYRDNFRFGPEEVLAAERLLLRKINQAQLADTDALLGAIPKLP